MMGIGNITIVFSLFFIGGCFASIPEAWLIVGLISALLVPWLWWKQSKSWLWLIAGLIACFASFYVQWRTPQPQVNDISRFAPLSEIRVRGEVLDSPIATHSGRARLTLQTNEIKVTGKSEIVSGKLYTTIGLNQATGLRPGQLVEISGSLY